MTNRSDAITQTAHTRPGRTERYSFDLLLIVILAIMVALTAGRGRGPARDCGPESVTPALNGEGR